MSGGEASVTALVQTAETLYSGTGHILWMAHEEWGCLPHQGRLYPLAYFIHNIKNLSKLLGNLKKWFSIEQTFISNGQFSFLCKEYSNYNKAHNERKYVPLHWRGNWSPDSLRQHPPSEGKKQSKYISFIHYYINCFFFFKKKAIKGKRKDLFWFAVWGYGPSWWGRQSCELNSS